MNKSKIKKALRVNISVLPEQKQEKIKHMLYVAAKADPQTFENLVNRLARKRELTQEREKAYEIHIQSPEYQIPYVWTKSSKQ